MNWVFPAEEALPAGTAVNDLATACSELGRERLAQAAAIIGAEKAATVAKSLGAYELGGELVRGLELEGLVLGDEGEFPALSPKAWTNLLPAESMQALRKRLTADGAELRGLLLGPGQRGELHAFLDGNRRQVESAWELVEIARHFFFSESIKVVVQYTAPSLNQP